MKMIQPFTPAGWLLVAAGAGAVIGAAASVFGERIGNSAIRCLMDETDARAGERDLHAHAGERDLYHDDTTQAIATYQCHCYRTTAE